MGGRVASLVADELHAAGRIAGLVCLGYPFHPPNKPEQLRTAHLERLACPALIVQGERDPFGGRAEVEGYALSAAIRFHWASDGDHDLGPRGGSGFTRKGNLAAAADAIAAFARDIARDERPGVTAAVYALRTPRARPLRQALRQHAARRARITAADAASTRNSASKPQFS